MQRFKKRTQKIGLPPGTLIHTGEKKAEIVKISIIDYNEKVFQEKELESVEDCFQYKDKSTITWININGVHEVDIIEKIGKHFNIHPLILEDVVNTDQRPKIDVFEDYISIILKIPYYAKKKQVIDTEQVSIIFGNNFLISFQENEKYFFDPIRERLRKIKYPIRKFGSDYLAYTLIDIIVDNCFTILEKLDEKINSVEEKLLGHPTKHILHTIHDLKWELLFLNRSIWPLREVVNSLERGESPLIKNSTKIYFRDLYDHTLHIIENIETFREMITSMMDIYLSSLSNKMNETMMFLTIIGTIFIPLTFITGIYGMNFIYMPEIGWRFGYPIAMLFMAGIAILMLFYFKKKKWL